MLLEELPKIDNHSHFGIKYITKATRSTASFLVFLHKIPNCSADLDKLKKIVFTEDNLYSIETFLNTIDIITMSNLNKMLAKQTGDTCKKSGTSLLARVFR